MSKNIAVIGLKGLPGIGGAATVGENIISLLKHDYDFTVYSISSHTDLRTGVYNGYNQIVFKKFPIKWINIYYYYFRSTLHCLLFRKYDAIHVHHASNSIIVPFLNLKYKTILTCHSSVQKIRHIDFKYNKMTIRFIRISEYFLKYANIITSVSKNLSTLISNHYSVPVTYIPNGININRNNTNSNNKVVEDSNYILFGAGRIIPTKGCHILLEALNHINSKNRVIIVGDSTQNQKYTNRLVDLSKNLNIKFLGLVKNKSDLFSIIINSKYFIFPSSLEAMSMMLLEVASCKTPIICSDIIENTDIFSDDEVKFFKSGDYLDLAQKIKWADNNYESFREMADKAYQKLLGKYTWSKIAPQYSNLYNELLNK